MRDVLADDFRCVAKKAPTLGNTLCPSPVQATDSNKPTWLKHYGCYKGAHGICTCCKLIEMSQAFTSAKIGLTYNIKQYINCNTTYVVYLITCWMCNIQYVGSTIYKLKVTSSHRSLRFLCIALHTMDRMFKPSLFKALSEWPGLWVVGIM